MRIIAGPCQHESLELSLEIADECSRVCEMYDMEYYFKASFDKANRSHINGGRGVGLIKTMQDFLNFGVYRTIPIVTDVHDEAQIDIVKNYVDVIQIPAFLSRQTDLIQAACDTDCIVNIKKGQFMAPVDVHGILSKTHGDVWITERGVTHGYNNLVVDFTGMQYMLDNYNVPIVFDATHAVQRPGLLGESSGGNRDYVPGLTRAAAALGVQNFFLEVHPDPDSSPSDASNTLYLDDFERVIHDIHRYSYSG